jgi:hypothetical protein
MESHAVSIAQLSEIQNGESNSDVERRLGVPKEILRSKSGDSWVYGGEFTWCIVAIHFDANGVVSGIEHDH